MVEWTFTIQGHALNATTFPIDIFDAAFPFGKLLVITGFACFFRQEQGTLEALGTIAIGVIELPGWMHEESFGASWGSISIPCKGGFAVLVERNCADASMSNRTFIDIPRIIGRITGNMGGKLIERDDRLLVERAKIRDIAFIERLGVFGKDDSSIVNDGGDGNSRPISPNEFLF